MHADSGHTRALTGRRRLWDSCRHLVDLATESLGRRDPAHPAIVGATVHGEGTYLGEDGLIILNTRSGACCQVVVFELDGGGFAAIGVGRPGISQTPIALDGYGPGR
jgi:hypothetical protein